MLYFMRPCHGDNFLSRLLIRSSIIHSFLSECVTCQICGMSSDAEVCVTSVSLAVYESSVTNLSTVNIPTYIGQRTCSACIPIRILVSDLHFYF